MADSPLYGNGLHPDTGEYLFQLPADSDIVRAVTGAPIPKSQQQVLQTREDNIRNKDHYGVKYGVDPKKLDQSGWAVIVAADDPGAAAALEALQPLLDHRKRLAGDRYRPPYTYVSGTSSLSFLSAQGAGPGLCDPAVVPYYLLLVGSPQFIPYEFQYQLDVQYGVGRIVFDTPQEYEYYARSVVRAEAPDFAAPKTLALFGPSADPATTLSAKYLIAPLAAQFQANPAGWNCHYYTPAQSDKAQLTKLLGGEDTPGLLLTASHGIGCPLADGRKQDLNGGLVCSNWPGAGPMSRDYFLTGGDLPANANLLGLIAFHFACFGAGTPAQSDLLDGRTNTYPKLAGQPFAARLPQRLLARPQGGALAIAGHIDTATDFTYRWDGVQARPGEAPPTQVFQTYESVLRALMDGVPAGFALEYFNNRYAEMSTLVSQALTDKRNFVKVSDAYVASYWRANTDARNFVLFGDPAVRLKTSAAATQQERIAMSIATAGSNPADTPQPSSAEPAPGQAEFFLGIDSDSVKAIKSTIEGLCAKVGEVLAKAYDNVATVDVETYTAANAAQVKVADGSFDGATLRAVSRISLDGRAKACIPVDADGKPDEILWKLHSEMVDRALSQRVEVLKLASGLASQLMSGVKL